MGKVGFTIRIVPFILLGSFCLAQTVNDGPTQGQDIQYQSSNSTLSANWSGLQTYAGDTYTIAWSTNTGFNPIIASQSGIPLTTTSITVSGVSLTNGQTYFARVQVITPVNTVRASANSNGVTVDSTNPVAGTVSIIDVNGNPITTQSSTTTIRASWSGFSDSESGIYSNQWAIGSTPGGTDIQNFTNVGSSTTATNSNLNLIVGNTYYVRVIATNGAGLQSSATSPGVTITGGTVYDGVTIGVETRSQSSTTTISANWSGFTLAFTTYTMKIATDKYFTVSSTISTTANIPPATNVLTISGLTLSFNTTYYVKIISVDSSGNQVQEGTSSGVSVINSPGPGRVFDGTTIGVETSYQSSTTSISANWSGFSPNPAPSGSYTFAVFQSTNLGTAIFGPVNVGLAATITYTTAQGLPNLTNGSTYFIRIVSSTGETEYSPGVTIDTTTPTAGQVFDGNVPNQEIPTQTSTTTIYANWTGFSDPVSGIAGYQWAIGTTSGGTQVQAFTNAGISGSTVTVGGANYNTGTTAATTGLALTVGTRYFVTVRAISGNGVAITATSPGVTVNNNTPTPGTVFDGNTPGVEVPFQQSTTTLYANWSGFIFPNGLKEYFVGVGTYAGGTNVYHLPDMGVVGVGQVASVTIYSLTLVSGTRYFVSIVGQDNSNPALLAVAVSSGVTVDARPPVAGRVFDGAIPSFETDSQFSTTGLSVNWTGFSDSISGIGPTVQYPAGPGHYEWAVGTTSGGTNVQNYMNVGTAATGTYTNSALQLIPGQKYYSSIKAIDNVGNFTIVTSPGIAISGTPPPSSGGGGGSSSGSGTIGLGSLGSASCGSVGLDCLVFIGIIALLRNIFRRKLGER